MNLQASIHGAVPPPLRRDPFSETMVLELDGHMRGSAFVLRGDVHGLRDKSSDGAWSYGVENHSVFGPFAAGMRGAFRRKRNDINAQSAIALGFPRHD
ncbi:MAG: hypothetical protein IOC90_10905 [Methylocystis sp.]|nr:hypothetical protein [Methylocystis sp.]MCA3582838.1 hypothetical protein [Methylocystis sp.]MCA3588526.1 hypothetical protein [Methylocystis sp.]MCA3590597.1 hypothetical protein [Methylocystis sp.]